MWLQLRLYLLVVLLFAILYGVFVFIGELTGIGNTIVYLVAALLVLGFQYLLGPYIVSLTMRVRWVSPQEAPELHRMVTELAEKAGLPRPRVGISETQVPNAFAFGRSHRDGRVCVTRGILNILNRDELKAVLAHEISHIKHRDMAVITFLSAVPMILYWVALSFMWGGYGGRRDRAGYGFLIGIMAFLLYFITNLLVLYGSRIREYYADLGSVRLGSRPHYLANALYKLTLASAHPRVKQELKNIESARAFFVNDPSRAALEVGHISQIDRGGDGTIGYDDMIALRQRNVRLGMGDKLAELFTTHPNMVKRIKHLAMIAV